MKDLSELPYPGNIQHVDNLNTIEKLEILGFQGPDVSLAISLFEYGLIWVEIPEHLRDYPEEDYMFIFKVANSGTDHELFARVGMFSSQFDNDINWIKGSTLGSFMSCIGQTNKEWRSHSYPYKIFDLFNYFGYENIFGSTIYGNFEIRDPEYDYGSSPMPGETDSEYYSRLVNGDPEVGEPWIPTDFIRDEDRIWFVSPGFGDWMCQWHNGMDAVYAVGSSVIANNGVDLDVVQDAIHLMSLNVKRMSERGDQHMAAQAEALRDIMQCALKAKPSKEPQYAEL